MAFVAGSLSVLSMAPFFIWPVLFLTLPVLVWLIDGAGAEAPRRLPLRSAMSLSGGAAVRRPIFRAAFAGWWFGLGYFLFGLFWIGEAFLAHLLAEIAFNGSADVLPKAPEGDLPAELDGRTDLPQRVLESALDARREQNGADGRGGGEDHLGAVAVHAELSELQPVGLPQWSSPADGVPSGWGKWSRHPILP